MATQITATLPTLDFPKEVDYPTQEDWAAFSAAAELNFGLLGGDWSTQMQLWKTQANAMSTEFNTNATIAQGLANYQGDWTSQGYTLGKTVSVGEVYYICKLTHSTGQNPTDVSSLYWNLAIGNWSLKADKTEVALKVNNYGHETIAGIKTFTSFPITPSSAPTTNYQVANKKYVDDRTVASSETVSGIVELATTAESQAGTDDSRAITPLKLKNILDSRLLYRATAVNSTSGTSIDFTGIPSWVKRITVMFSGVSTNGTSVLHIQLGSGTIQTTGYECIASGFTSTDATTLGFTSGFATGDSSAGAQIRNGHFEIVNIASNRWLFDGGLSLTGLGKHIASGGVTLSGTLDRIRITTVNGTDTFDAGQINIMYEG